MVFTQWRSPVLTPSPCAVSEQPRARLGDRGVLRLREEWGPVSAAGVWGWVGLAPPRCNLGGLIPPLSFQKSIRPQVVTTFELPGCYDMWTVIAPVRKEQVGTSGLSGRPQGGG